MLIQHTEDRTKGIFFVPGDGNEKLAELVYFKEQPNIMILEHTSVDDELRGQTVGYQLVHTAVEFARTNDLRIVPTCPFVKSVFEKRPELRDVVD